ncbi:MAG: hypothetical protein IPF99_25055 [Deltaproteobacteria bacterium]|nr:hypothetical protein [Deltaproteobacteria bacterium]
MWLPCELVKSTSWSPGRALPTSQSRPSRKAARVAWASSSTRMSLLPKP